jgi:hypothetical protein
MHESHRRDAGLRKVSIFTRRVVYGAIAVTAGVTALVARVQPARAKTANGGTTTPTTPAATTGQSGSTATTATPGTLPPDTFSSTGDSPQTSPQTTPQTSPQTTPQTSPDTSPYVAPQAPLVSPDQSQLPPAVSSGSS